MTVEAVFGPPPELPGSSATLNLGYTQSAIPVDVTSELVSVAVGAAGAQGGAGAGSLNLNFVRETVVASITSDTTATGMVQAGGAVSVVASDSATVVAVGGALGVGVGLKGAGVAIGISAGRNDISNSVLAYVDGTNVTAQGGDILIQATEAATIEAYTIGGALGVGVSGGGAGVGVGAAGAGSGNTISNTVKAYAADGASLTSTTGDINMSAVDTPTIVANAGGVAIGIGVSTGGAGVAASVGVAAAVNNVNDYVYAYINDSSATAAGSLAIWSNTGGDIVFQTPDELNTGDTVVFHVGSAGATAPGGLVDGTTYYVVKLSDNEIALADSLADALRARRSRSRRRAPGRA